MFKEFILSQLFILQVVEQNSYSCVVFYIVAYYQQKYFV